jgi:hypothetical protein
MTTYGTTAAAIARAHHLPRTSDQPLYVVREGEGYAVADESDLDTWWLGATVIAEVMSDGTCVPSE